MGAEEVSPPHPVGSFPAMAPASPAPELTKDHFVDVLKGSRGNQMSERIGPAAEAAVELMDEKFRWDPLPASNVLPQIPLQAIDVGLGRFHQKLAPVLADVGAEEIEAVADGSDLGLLLRESQTPFLEKGGYGWDDMLFQNLATVRGDQEVVGVADDIDLGSRGLVGSLRSGLPDTPLEAVERQVAKHWRDDASLWSAFLRGMERTAFHVTGFQPLAQDTLVHGDVSEQPFVTDVIEARLNVRIEHPLGCIATC